MSLRNLNTRLLLVPILVLGIWLNLQPNRVLAVPVTLVVSTAVDDSAVPPAQCSLRYAILAVNADFAGGGTGTSIGNCTIPAGATSYTITFNADYTINIDPLADLPALTADNVTIDGNRPLNVLTILNGDGVNTTNGLTITGSNNLITGIQIDNMVGSGILIDGAAAVQNQIHTTIVIAPAGGVGLTIDNGASENEVYLSGFRGGLAGVQIINSSQNVIGSITEPVYIRSQGPAPANGIHITGVGSTLNQVVGNRIGGTLIDGNGLLIDAGANGNRVSSNIISTSGATGDGIRILNAPSNTIGISNIIQNNQGNGIYIENSDNTFINSNIIRNQNSGGGQNGVEVINSSGVRIERNTINQNSGFGVVLNNSPGSNIEANVILNSGSSGIEILNTSSTTIVQNTVRSNGGDGLRINVGDNNFIGNNIFNNNGRLGINLVGNDLASGVTLNDAGDGDAGTNDLQNFPVFTASSDRSTLNVVGGVDSTGLFDVELFLNTVIDPSGFGEAQRRLPGGGVIGGVPGGPGGIDAVIGGVGDVVGQYLTATASQRFLGSSTSELSAARRIYLLAASFIPNPAVGYAPYTVTFTNTTQSELAITGYFWNLGNGQTSTLANPTATYSSPGTYTVILTVWNVNGNYDRYIGTVVVLPPPTNTPVPTIPPSATSTPTETTIPTNTATFTPIPTNTPSVTPSRTATSTATFTDIPTSTPSSTVTPLPTSTPIPTQTNTPLPSPTDVPTSTWTMVPSATPTEAIPDLDVTKQPGTDTDIVIVVVNNGPGDAQDVILVEDLRPGVVYVSSIPGVPVCLEQSGSVTCGLGSLASGDSATVSIDVESDGVDPVSGSTTVISNGMTIVQLDRPYLSKLAQPSFAQPGEPITYTLRVINPTQQDASSVRVTDRMPDGVTINSISSSSGRAGFSGQNVTFTQASLSAGGRITITIEATLDEDAEGLKILNEACMTSSLNDVDEPSCAEYSFRRASSLPATGESSRNHRLLIIGLAGLISFALFMTRKQIVRLIG